jgi:anthranilate synthase component 1
LVPVFIEIPADLLTPVAAYLKVAHGSEHSFLLESVTGGESLARYSFVGAGKLLDPFGYRKLKFRSCKDNTYRRRIRCRGRSSRGSGKGARALSLCQTASGPYIYRSALSHSAYRNQADDVGGAVGFITYDSINHFEPVTKPATPLANPLPGLPEAFFMLAQSVIIFDHIYQTIKIVSHVHIPDGTPPSNITTLYDDAVGRIEALRQKLISPEIVFPKQGPITLGEKAESNVGKAGYEGFVTKLKQHIVKGDIIQAVPSQRLARKSALHPFNIYRHLRRLNPSPYMFYLDCGDVQIVGASPETLCKVEKRKVYNHAIAGTVKRGKTAEGELIYTMLCGQN